MTRANAGAPFRPTTSQGSRPASRPWSPTRRAWRAGGRRSSRRRRWTRTSTRSRRSTASCAGASCAGRAHDAGLGRHPDPERRRRVPRLPGGDPPPAARPAVRGDLHRLGLDRRHAAHLPRVRRPAPRPGGSVQPRPDAQPGDRRGRGRARRAPHPGCPAARHRLAPPPGRGARIDARGGGSLRAPGDPRRHQPLPALAPRELGGHPDDALRAADHRPHRVRSLLAAREAGRRRVRRRQLLHPEERLAGDPVLRRRLRGGRRLGAPRAPRRLRDRLRAGRARPPLARRLAVGRLQAGLRRPSEPEPPARDAADPHPPSRAALHGLGCRAPLALGTARRPGPGGPRPV